MNNKEQERNLREELKAAFSDEYINGIGYMIYCLAKEFYKQNKLDGYVYFNEDIFERCLIDILVDIARLKHFHQIEKVNYLKLIAYTASWFLKRKPFQIIENAGDKYVFVNETFALTLLLQAANFYDSSVKYCEDDEKEIIEGVRKVFYHLKYRNTNPQTLELFLLGIENGKRVHIV